jgi:CheY-like chemotaxis protein
VLFLTETKRHDQALKLALRAHDADLCYIRDVPEFAAFLPAADAAGITIDLVVIDQQFDPAAFNIAAANRLNFRMLPEASGESRALAEILNALPRQRLSLVAPSIEPPQPVADEPAEVSSEAGGSAGLDVLAVEDNSVNRMVLEQMLGSLSVSFRIAGTAAEALADCAQHAPRLVLSDTTLPDMSTADFALGLRRIDPSAALIALVPRDSEEYHRQAKAAGFDHSLSKPLSAEALGALIPDLLTARIKRSVGPAGSS